MMLYDVYLDIDILKNPGINCFFSKELSMVRALNPPPPKKTKKKTKQTKKKQKKYNNKQNHNKINTTTNKK